MSPAMKVFAMLRNAPIPESVNSDNNQRQSLILARGPFRHAVLAAISVFATASPYAINYTPLQP